MELDISLIISVGLVVLFSLVWAIWAINQQMKHREELDEIQETIESQTVALDDADRELEKLRRKIELMRKERDLLRRKRLDLRKERYELRNQLNDARDERDALLTQLENLTDFLVEVGVLRPDFDPLAVSGADLLWDLPDSVLKLPEVEDLDRSTLLQALRHAEARDDNWADRPFSRRYMVNDGPLSRSQLRALRSALLEKDYLLEPDRPQEGYKLTAEGEKLLHNVVNGIYDTRDEGEQKPTKT